MAGDVLYRGRLLLLSSAVVAGGALGCRGRLSLFWITFPGAILLVLSAAAGLRGRVAAVAAGMLILFHMGVAYSFREELLLAERRGTCGRVAVVGRIEVSNRGGEEAEGFLFRAVRVESGSLARPGERYLVRKYGEGGPAPVWGDVVRVEGLLRIPARGGTGVDGYLGAERWELLGSSASPALRAAVWLRRGLARQVESRLPPREAALVEGILLGDYRRLSLKDLVALRSSGLLHLCAVSGLHVGILVSGLLWLGRRLSVHRRLLVLLQVPLIFLYALAAGLSVPVLRASLVAAAAGAAFLFGRDFDFLSALGASMALLFLRDPGVGLSVSFQLSFAAALGVALLRKPLCSLMRAGDSGARQLLATTLAAQVAVAPVLALHFGRVSLLAVIGNLLVLPVLPLLMGLTLLSALLGMVGVPGAGTAMTAALPLVRWIMGVAGTTASCAWAEIRLPSMSAWWVAAYYAALAAAVWSPAGTRRLARAALGTMLLAAFLLGTGWATPHRGVPEGTRLTFFDVGQGDACLVEDASGAAVLVDGGKEEARLAEELRSRGVRYLDLVVVSHADSDHVGGLAAALEECWVGAVVCASAGMEGTDVGFFRRAEEMGVPVREVARGDIIAVGNLTLRVMAPPADVEEGLSRNDLSLVLEVKGRGIDLVLPGDVEEAGQEALLEGGVPDCDVLKVPHHGGYVEGGEELLRRLRPEIAVISVGRDNSYGHPSPAVLQALERMGCAIYRTDERGDIVIVSEEGGFRVHCER